MANRIIVDEWQIWWWLPPEMPDPEQDHLVQEFQRADLGRKCREWCLQVIATHPSLMGLEVVVQPAASSEQ